MIAFGPHDLTNVEVPEVEQTGASSQFYDKFSAFPAYPSCRLPALTLDS